MNESPQSEDPIKVHLLSQGAEILEETPESIRYQVERKRYAFIVAGGVGLFLGALLCIIPPFAFIGLPLVVLGILGLAAGIVGKTEIFVISRSGVLKD